MENSGKNRKITSFSEKRFQSFSLHLGPAMLIMFGLLPNVTPFPGHPSDLMLTNKRIPYPNVGETYGSPEYLSATRYDEYPIVVPKRPALILDRLLREIESARENSNFINDWSPITRRGQNDHPSTRQPKMYLKCYFNAISCFKRK